MIRVGIGGWTYEPWRGAFYPTGLAHADELAYASRHVTTVEINGTFYRTQSRASFEKWREATPEGFVFSVKAHRAAVNSRKLAEAGEQIDWFLGSGVLELGEKLGPILWQLAPFKRFDAEDLDGFLKLLPEKRDGRRLRHALEVRHASFLCKEFIALLRDSARAIGDRKVIQRQQRRIGLGDRAGQRRFARGRDAGGEQAPPALAGDLMARRHGIERLMVDRAARFREIATRLERAALGQLAAPEEAAQGSRHRLVGPVDARDRADQAAGIGMARLVEELGHRRDLDHVTGIHDPDAVGDL